MAQLCHLRSEESVVGLGSGLGRRERERGRRGNREGGEEEDQSPIDVRD